jgi:hypothetical protein
MAHRGLIGFLVLASCLLVSCGKDATGPAPVHVIEIAPLAPTTQVGQAVQLSATLRDANNTVLTGRPVEWTSSSTTLATVSGSGLVIPVAEGVVTIAASSEGKRGSIQVSITPPPVSSVEITPAEPSVVAGQIVQLNATLRDAANNVLTGRSVAWTTDNAAVATVDATGQVRGAAEGSAMVTATAEGKGGSTRVVVTAPAALVLSSVAPDSLVEGRTATLTGSGFSAVPANNVVTVDGVGATVTAASATSLQIVVPSTQCHPPRLIDVQVAVAGQTSNPVRRSVRPASFLSLAVGQQMVVQDAARACLQFAPSAGTEAYLIGIQSISEVASSLTPVRIGSVATAGATAMMSVPATPPSASNKGPDLMGASGSERVARWTRHRSAEIGLRAQQHRHLNSRVDRGLRPTDQLSATRPTAVPKNVVVGDTVAVRVPNREGTNLCTEFTTIKTVARVVGARGVWLEDAANPSGGFATTDFQSLSDVFDSHIYRADTEYFGAPTDFDENGRIVIVTTKEVNKTEDLLGFVSFGDLFPRAECASSDEGEIYYGRAPDPSGAFGEAYSRADALLDAPVLIAHEFAHLIQVGRRITFPGASALQTVWELEGQATLAEEVVGHQVTGRRPRQNYGFGVALNQPKAQPIDWYLSGFVDLAVYYGFQSSTSKVPNAPEQCSWVGSQDDGNDGPCLPGREVYGVPWSFLRWISDHFGPTYPGGEPGLHRALIDNRYTGFATIADVLDSPIDVLLMQWAAALYVDDRVPAAAPRLTLPSWNLLDIERGLFESARLQPRERGFSTFSDAISVRGGSTAYFRISGAGRGATAVNALGTGGNPLPASVRVWVVRLQ